MHRVSQNPALDLSPFLAQLVKRHPAWLEDLAASGRLEKDSPPAAQDLAKAIGELGLDRALRRYRNHEMLRIVWRDLNGLAPLKETLSDLSTLAERCLQSAVAWHSRVLEEKHGTPRSADGGRQDLVVLGLGKLGGRELNLSSDIDIVFCFPESGQCDGRRGFANEQFFTRLARLVIRSLSEVTADGFCFRVDTRLRPFGESGPLVSSFAALEQYYQREGRDWERYALVKARTVAGDRKAGSRLLAILKPFVYRRYIDFGAIEALREMHENVREDAHRNDRMDDIKRGPGGIREIEFLVQTFQLLRGGREPGLQTPSIFKALDTLGALHLLPEASINDLLGAYDFLRRLENRIQALHDQQTHRVPAGEDGERVARAMGFDDTASFKQALDSTRARVQGLFERSLPQSPKPADERDPWHRSWQNLRHGRGVEAGDKHLAAFVQRLDRLALSSRASQRLDQFMPLLLEKLEAMSPGDAVVGRVFDLVSAICQRSAYLSLLVQNPGATDSLLELFQASDRVARVVTRYPALLDELIDPSLGADTPARTDIEAGVSRIVRAGRDTETTLQELNYYKQVISLRVAVAILRRTLTVFEARHVLSWLAQCLVRAALDLAGAEVLTRHGRLPGPGLAVIAYGSLGAKALSFNSDLDLIFLYAPGKAMSDGPRPVSPERYHTVVARRMLGLLSATTPSGRLYSIDARLRPNGRAGLLVSSTEAFERYQNEEAWVWELQALTRARPVAGSADVGSAFRRIRQTVLCLPRDEKEVREAISDMRTRVRSEHNDPASIKYGEGGLVDIEFAVQLGLLANAQEAPSLVASTELCEQIEALHRIGWIGDEDFTGLVEGYTRLSQARLFGTLTAEADESRNQAMLDLAKAFCNGILG